jgi:pyruvate/2-oxoacid:ferredoxin oxidoreductase alpha subunit
VSTYTHTPEGYDIEEMEAQWAQTYRLVNKIRHHRDQLTRYETVGVEDAEVIAVAYGANARTVKTGVLGRGGRASALALSGPSRSGRSSTSCMPAMPDTWSVS